MPLSVSNTFFLSDTGGVNNPAGAHLMVCLAIDKVKDTAVIVPIVSRHENSDASCVLNVGDHPFIKHESCAAYDFARVVSLSGTSGKVAKGQIRLQESVSAEVLTRLQVGFVVSDETAPVIFDAGNGAKLTAWLKHKGHIA